MSEAEPLFAFTLRMQIKDSALYESTCMLPIPVAAAKWREKYPNDLPENLAPYVELTPEQETEYAALFPPTP